MLVLKHVETADSRVVEYIYIYQAIYIYTSSHIYKTRAADRPSLADVGPCVPGTGLLGIRPYRHLHKIEARRAVVLRSNVGILYTASAIYESHAAKCRASMVA